ncbi:hypothetical protein ACFVJ5_08255 [Nocardia sp. NPDC127606]|uniref:hypothetical protein n=1 Tax=Nocardia sp. NPDC127606 TaxID=3345406 RepID=UPI003635BD67
MRMKSTVAKTAVAGTLALGVLGATAGVASADPGGHDQQRPEQSQEHRPQQQPEHHRNDAPQHGFWFFGTWVPLP